MSAESQRLRVSRFLLWMVAGIAGVLVLWSLPTTIRFLPDAPPSFWAMVVCSLLVDVPLFGMSRREDIRIRSTLTVCFTFAIFVLWGAQQAIVVQAVAGTVTVIGQQYLPRAGLYLVARLICAAGAGGLFVSLLTSRPINEQGSGLDGGDLLVFVLLAVVWLVVGYGLLAAARVALSRDLRRENTDLRRDLISTAAAILLVAPLLTTMRGWWVLIPATALFGLNLVGREQVRREQRLTREPVSGSLNRQGLAVGIQELTATDPVGAQALRAFGVVAVVIEEVLTVNKTLGRDIYEQVATVATRRLSEVYGRDRVARLAGEGIYVLIPDLTEQGAVAAAEAAAALVSQRIDVDGIPFRLDPVAGVSLSPLHGRDLTTLLAKAELAVAEARRNDRRAMLYVRQAETVMGRRLELLRDVRAALADPTRRDELVLLYQPQVELRTGRLVAAEALLRWTHPQWGLIPADELIDAVEATEVMHLLTQHVIRAAATQLRRWVDRDQRFRVAVNVSVQDLHDPDFIQDLQTAIARAGVPPALFTIELTERMLISDAPRVAHVCHTLADLGFALSLDDFGTGYASLQQLRQLPLTEVKIDRSYVSGIVDSPADRAVVTSVHQLAQTLNLQVVAEGVEDERIVRALATLPGTIGQGYHFGRPMPADEFEEWQRSRSSQRPSRLAHAGRARPSRWWR